MYEKRENKSLKRRIEKFVQRGEEKYGKVTYDYSIAKKEYSNNRTPVHLICNTCKDKRGKDYTFLVYPFAHTYYGDNDKGTCPICYEQKQTVQETRWNPNLSERIDEFENIVNKKYQGSLHLPYVKDEYKNESSKITVICKQCKSKPFTRLARSLKAKDRIGGCEVCNKQKNQKKTNALLSERQLRNHATKHEPRDYGCIYKITNTKNNKVYIGYTNMTAERRLKAHTDETRRMQKGKKGRSSYLHNAMNHHGFKSFKIEILEEHTEVTPHFLAAREMKYIAIQKPHYNLSPGGEIGRSKIHPKKAS